MIEKEAIKLQEIMYSQYPWFRKTKLNARVLFRVFEKYDFQEISELVLELLRSPDRQYPPTTNDIFRLRRDKLAFGRKEVEIPKEEASDDEYKGKVVKEMHETFPELFN